MGLVFDLWALLEAGHQGERGGLDGQAPRRRAQHAGAQEAEPSGEEVTYLVWCARVELDTGARRVEAAGVAEAALCLGNQDLRGRGVHWLWPVVYHVRVEPAGLTGAQGTSTHYVRLGHNGQQCQVLEERDIP